MRKVITDKHPFMKKVNALYEYMEDNGIVIIGNSNDGLNIVDTINNKTYHLRDISNNEISSVFPSGTEFKLTYENNIDIE